MNKIIENNQVTVVGKLVSGFTYSHEFYGEKFYMADLECERISGTCDTLPVMVSDRLMDMSADYTNELICVEGQYRSFNLHDEKTHKLILYVFARDITFLDAPVNCKNNNLVSLSGYLCKTPHYRETPLGKEITDLLLAVNRSYGKSDYIPCIAWGRNARYVGTMDIGSYLTIKGRIQSREYIKTLDDGTTETRKAYEVSVMKLEVITDEEQSN